LEKAEAESEERVEPGPVQVALLYKILKAQREILQFLKETTPEGVDVPFPDSVVTDMKVLNFVREYPYRRLRSLDLFNKGPSTAYYRVNEDAKEVEVENRESVRVERPRATIEYMTLRVDTGQTTTIQLTGHY